MIVEIALNLPLRQIFDYDWPDRLKSPPQLGTRVFVPFGPHKKSGVVVKIKLSSDFAKLKEIESVLDDTPVFSKQLLELTQWVGEYYFCSWGEVLSCAIPGGLGIRLHTVYNRQVESQQLNGLEKLSPQILKLIEAQTSWNLQEWKQALATENDQKQLIRWLKDKTVERIQTLVDTKVKPKMERWVQLVEMPSPLKKNLRKQTKREKILTFLQEHSEISLSVLKDHIPTPAQAVKKLKEEGIINIFEKRVYRRFLQNDLPSLEPFLPLNPDQEKSYKIIEKSVEQEEYQTFLLHGVTGSGKTEVYLHAVKTALEKGKQCLILVPEISLTPQLVNRFRTRFGDLIAVLHSGMDEGERFDEWSKMLSGEVAIAIGARSAVFSPLENIGLIVVDEEHDSSYKQEDAPRYNGRDVAIYRGYCSRATVILGSATPSLESCYNVIKEKFQHLTLPSRILQASLPEVVLLNLKHCPRQKGSYFFSVQMVESLRQRLLRKEQSLLFLNRRGYASLVQCQSCQEAIVCPNCSLSLVYHQSVGMLQCHQCDHTIPMPQRCPYCSERELKILGVGTEQIESELKIMFPEARLLRMDRDTLRRKHSLTHFLEQIRNHEVDIIVGTQLVTKGHDFSNITFVGVILADLSLNFPDFRSAERTFQLLTQVAGRAGRGEKSGEVLIQTYNPQHHSLVCTQAHNFNQFQDRELNIRRQLNAPPFISLVLVIFSSPKESHAQSLASQFDQNLTHVEKIDFHQMGPIEAPIKKINKRFRWMIILKASHVKLLHSLLHQALHFPSPLSPHFQDRISIDINPYNFL